jgi:hypothetical protein
MKEIKINITDRLFANCKEFSNSISMIFTVLVVICVVFWLSHLYEYGGLKYKYNLLLEIKIKVKIFKTFNQKRNKAKILEKP